MEYSQEMQGDSSAEANPIISSSTITPLGFPVLAIRGLKGLLAGLLLC